MDAKTLGKYQLISLLGSGATADVYRARDEVLGREVALKVLKPSLVVDAAAFERFIHEARSAAGLFQPNIATVLDMGEAEGRYFIAMRFYPGQSLDKILKENGPLSWEDTLKMTEQIGAALDYAHGQGFLHRDVKPSNILRTPEGDFILTDFGLTRAMMSTGLTSHTGAVLGTPSYIAPEIWEGKPATPATDQYALACVVYEALTGQVLFAGETPPVIMTRHVLKGAELPEAWPEGTPVGVTNVIRNALDKDSARRYPNSLEFVLKLKEFNTATYLGVALPASDGIKIDEFKQPSREEAEIERAKPTAAPSEQGIGIRGLKESAKVNPKEHHSSEMQNVSRPVPSTLPVHSPQRKSSNVPLIIGGVFILIVIVCVAISAQLKNIISSSSELVPTEQVMIVTPVVISTTPVLNNPTKTVLIAEKEVTLTFTPEPTSNQIAPTVEATLGIGSIVLSEKDNMPLVYVPEGEFLMGSIENDIVQIISSIDPSLNPESSWFSMEKPQHVVYLDSFWVDQTEVTNAMYKKCMDEGGCSPPSERKSNSREVLFLQ